MVIVGGNAVKVAVALEKAVGVAVGVVATVPGSSPQIKAPCR